MTLNQYAKISCTALMVSLFAVAPSLASPGKTVPGKKHAVAAKTEGQAYKLDPAASSLKWIGTKVTGKHTGSIKLASGDVVVDQGKLKSGYFVADMTTIKNEDLTDPAYNKKLIDHLRSDDFFSVEKYPTAEFKITQAEPIANAAEGKPNYNITGDLMIKGKTQSVSFPAVVTVTDSQATAKGTMTVDRTKYDIKYGSGKFFQGLGDKLIHDEFKVDVDLVGKM